MVMNANGVANQILARELDGVHDLFWYPKLESLGFLYLPTLEGGFKAGLYTLRVKRQGDSGVIADELVRSIPDDFRVKFYAPRWKFNGDHNVPVSDAVGSRDYYTRITFSPGGEMIAGIATYPNPSGQGFEAAMCVVPADGSAAEHCNRTVRPCLTNSPVWSPSSDKIVFAGAMRQDAVACNLAEIYIADANLTNVAPLTDVPGPKLTDANKSIVRPGMTIDSWHKSSHPRWSPDGRWIAFMSYGGIYKIHPDGTDQQLIIRDGSYPAWSPDSRMLAYVLKSGSPFSSIGPSDRIFVAHLDGSNPTEIPLKDDCKSKCSYADLNWTE
jgi:Tol biopolymer transport system component